MTNDWAEVDLDSLVEILDHQRKPLSKIERAERTGPFPYYGASGVIDHLDDYLFEERLLLVAEDGENLNSRKLPVAFIAEGKYWVNNHAHVLRARPGLADLDFLAVALRHHPLDGAITGAAQPKLTQENLRRLRVRIPAYEVQVMTGHLARMFDDLIENNQRRIHLLEESARLLYREWFVNFRYPGHEKVPLVDSELGPVPEGWGTTSLDQRACLTRSSITPGDYPSEMFDHFSLPAFDEKSEPAVESGESIKSHKYLVDGECVLWSKLNPRFPRIWWTAPFITERRSVASTEFLVLTVNGGWRLPFIYSLVSSELFSLTMAARANGTSNSHQRVAPSDVMTYPILDPEDSIQERFSDLVEPFLQLKSELIIQNRSLTQTRDLLLPRLVSGDLDVSDLESDLEAVN